MKQELRQRCKLRGHILNSENLYVSPTGKRKCKACHILWRRKHPTLSTNYSRKWRAEHPEADRASRSKWKDKHPTYATDQSRMWRYGLTAQDYATLLEKQNNNCAICEHTFDQTPAHAPCIDHNHTCCPYQKTCGKCIRGILCATCNRRLGWYESPASSLWIESARIYLSKYST